jgi:hypothetical protein
MRREYFCAVQAAADEDWKIAYGFRDAEKMKEKMGLKIKIWARIITHLAGYLHPVEISCCLQPHRFPNPISCSPRPRRFFRPNFEEEAVYAPKEIDRDLVKGKLEPMKD